MQVNSEVYVQLKTYSEAVGIPASRVIEEALGDWLETVGIARLEALAGAATLVSFRTPDNVVCIEQGKGAAASA